MTFRTWAALILICVAAAARGVSAAGSAALDRWLERQAVLETWSARVEQTRTLKSLARPLVSEGQVWFAQPNRFRWELGDPPRTIAVRAGDGLVVAYPRLGQVERYAYGEQEDPALRQALALLEVGLPADPEAFHARYELLEAERDGSAWRFTLQPRETQARRLLERVVLEISAEDSRLLATELDFPDESVMRNEFSGHRLDPELPADLFELDLETAGSANGPPQ